jgi:hypothetical protein
LAACWHWATGRGLAVVGHADKKCKKRKKCRFQNLMRRGLCKTPATDLKKIILKGEIITGIP